MGSTGDATIGALLLLLLMLTAAVEDTWPGFRIEVMLAEGAEVLLPAVGG